MSIIKNQNSNCFPKFENISTIPKDFENISTVPKDNETMPSDGVENIPDKHSITSPISQVASSLAPSFKKYEECFLPPGSKRDSKLFLLQDSYEHSYASQSDISTDADLNVPRFYAGKRILVTGATGFVGKVLLEKLIRSCPGIVCIYCLIRPKKGQSPAERLKELTNSKLFDRLRKENPTFENKIKLINGDILQPELGLSPQDIETLQEKVNIVFHSAATVRFNEPLRAAVQMNVISVRKMLKLCRGFEKLESFVHVSTAYANCDRHYIEDKVYPPPVEPQKIIEVLEWMNDDMVEQFTPKLIGEKPNTYTYTKQLAEHLVMTEGADLPIAIVRPSIVGPTWKEPFPGWIDNWNGATGLILAAGQGVLLSMKGESTAACDVVPVDISVNVMITVAWYTATVKPDSALVYHAIAGEHGSISWGDIENVVNKSFTQIPLEGTYRRPNLSFVSNSLAYDFWTCVSHLLPAHIIDLAHRMVGKKPRMVKIYGKLHRSVSNLEFFTLNEWQWSCSNNEKLKYHLSEADQKMFFFDTNPVHWPTYFENYCLGAKKYVLKEDSSGLPAARAHVRKLRLFRWMFNTTVMVILWRTVIAKSHFARNLWFFIVSLVSKFVRFFRISSTMHK